MVIYDENMNTIELVGLKNADTGEMVDLATVSAEVRVSETGLPPAGVAASIDLASVAGSAGTYRASVIPTEGLAPGARLRVDVRVTAEGPVVGEWNVSGWLRSRGSASEPA